MSTLILLFILLSIVLYGLPMYFLYSRKLITKKSMLVSLTAIVLANILVIFKLSPMESSFGSTYNSVYSFDLLFNNTFINILLVIAIFYPLMNLEDSKL